MRRALGKGLAQLVGEEAEGSVHELPVEAIQPNPGQPRRLFDEQALAELAGSIAEHGVLQPILVRPVGHDRYEIVAGERRFRAAVSAGLARVPVVVRPADPRTALQYALVENVQRADIRPLEAAGAYARLADEFGMGHEEIAARVGKSRAAVSNTIRLLRLPEEVRAWLDDGTLTEGHARAAMLAGDDAAVLRVARKAVAAGLSVRQTEALARGEAPEPRVPAAPPDSDWERMAGGLARHLGTAVRVKRGRRVSKLEIEFRDLDDLDRVLAAMGFDPAQVP